MHSHRIILRPASFRHERRSIPPEPTIAGDPMPKGKGMEVLTFPHRLPGLRFDPKTGPEFPDELVVIVNRAEFRNPMD
jgi:hypothetical protein